MSIMTSREILDNRNNHKPVCRTSPVTLIGEGVVHQIKWDDGIITSLYDYGDGGSTHLHVVDAAYYEKKFLPTWIAEDKWRRENPSYHDDLLNGRSY